MRFFLILAALAAANVHAETIERIAQRYTLEQLQQTADYLMLRIEKRDTAVLKCDVDAEKAQVWLSASLHPLLDLKVESEVTILKKNPAAFLKRAKTCHTLCTCEAYASVLTEAEAQAPNSSELGKISEVLDQELKKENHLQCARKMNWFCKSSLKKFLAGE
ncbi:MAG: hypothetical protein ACXVA9_03190 [Bdellovibrionales bacterium]